MVLPLYVGYTLGTAVVGGSIYAAGTGVKKATSGSSAFVLLALLGVIAYSMYLKK